MAASDADLARGRIGNPGLPGVGDIAAQWQAQQRRRKRRELVSDQPLGESRDWK
jgi:hypothetical protein